MLILVSVHSPVAVWNMPAEYVSRLRREFPAHTFLHATNDAQTLALLPETDVLFSSEIDRQQLAAAPRLKWIHSPAAGVGGMLFPEMLSRPVVITNARGIAADTMAEHVLAVTLSFFRHLPMALARQVQHIWAQDEISSLRNRTIQGSNILVIGLGAIGSAVAKRMSTLGGHVTGIRRNSSGPLAEGVTAVLPPSQLLQALADADVVVVSAPHTNETRGLIGAPELAAMKPDAILVNVSRGRLVDETALAAAVLRGHLGGAALDVFEHEPLPPESPLWDLPNVLITPHTSGFRPDHWDVMTELFMQNLRRYEAGEPLLNIVDKNAGY